MALRINLGVLCAGAALALLPACSSDDGDNSDGGGAPNTGGSGSGTGGSGSGTGGSGTGGSATGGSGTGGDANADVCAPFATFEDGAKGFWIRKNTDATTGSITPTVADFTGEEVTVASTDGANGTTHSVLYSGSGFDGNANLGGINIANDLTLDDCKNASDYTGLSFWAKGTIAANPAEDGFSVDENQMIVFVGDGTNEMSYRISLEADWGNPMLAWDDAGWYPAGSVDVSAIKYVKFVAAGATFDIGIDEVGWYKE